MMCKSLTALNCACDDTNKSKSQILGLKKIFFCSFHEKEQA